MKYEWRKEEKHLYFPKKVEIVDVPEYTFFIIDGMGNPNDPLFSKEIEALYQASYSLRMLLKKGEFGEPFEYTVYPLEGLWTTSDGSRDDGLNKDALVYRIMIRQPSGVTKEMANQSLAQVKIKKDNPFLDQIKIEQYTDGKVVQMLHVGPFENEKHTFEQMKNFLKKTSFEPKMYMDNYAHREIYLSDARRVAPEKRKTLLRYQLKEKKRL